MIALDENEKPVGSGSAFFVGSYADGTLRRSILVTNYHVIRPAIYAQVLGPGKSKRMVWQVIAKDESCDLALVTVFHEPPAVLELDTGSSPPVGTKVFAIGSPLGLRNTLSEGLISGYREKNGSGYALIQFTAPISPGSSGGPLLTANGNAIGVTTSLLAEGQALTFAVPASEVKRLLHGPRKPGPVWMGASIKKAKELAYSAAFWTIIKQFPPQDREKLLRAPLNGDLNELEGLYLQHVERLAQSGDQLALLQKGVDDLAKKNYPSAIRSLTLATEAQPGEFEYLVHFTLGSAYSSVETEQAIASFKRAIALRPWFSPALSCLSDCYLRTKRFGDGLLTANSLVEVMPRCGDAYRTRAVFFSLAEQHERAIEDLKTAIELTPNDAGNYWLMGNQYAEIGQFEKAIDLLETAIGLEPSHASYHYRLGRILMNADRNTEAIVALQRAIKLGLGDIFEEGAKKMIARCRSRLRQ